MTVETNKALLRRFVEEIVNPGHEPGSQTEPLLQALDHAGRWLDIPLIVGNIASDQRQFTQAGFPAVGLSVGAAQLHTPGDAIERVQPEALRIAATLLLATLWQLAA